MGSSVNATLDDPPVGVPVGDDVEARPGAAVALGVSLSPDSSFANGANIGAGEASPPKGYSVGPLVGVTVA